MRGKCPAKAHGELTATMQVGRVTRVSATGKPACPAESRWRWMRIGKWRWQVNADFTRAEFLARLACPEDLLSPPARFIRPRREPGTTGVARLMAEPHNLGLWHADPSLTNFLVVPAPDQSWQVFLVDLDGLRRNRCFRRRRGLKNLQWLAARAAADAREPLVFLATYCRARRPPFARRQLAKQMRLRSPLSRSDTPPAGVPMDRPSGVLRGG